MREDLVSLAIEHISRFERVILLDDYTYLQVWWQADERFDTGRYLARRCDEVFDLEASLRFYNGGIVPLTETTQRLAMAQLELYAALGDTAIFCPYEGDDPAFSMISAAYWRLMERFDFGIALKVSQTIKALWGMEYTMCTDEKYVIVGKDEVLGDKAYGFISEVEGFRIVVPLTYGAMISFDGRKPHMVDGVEYLEK
jgi:hypothetical protein